MDTCHNLEETSDPPSNFLWSTFGDIRRCNSRDSSNPVTGQHSSSVNQRQTMGWSVCDGGENLHSGGQKHERRNDQKQTYSSNGKYQGKREKSVSPPNSCYIHIMFSTSFRPHKRGKWGSALGLLFFRRGTLMRIKQSP